MRTAPIPSLQASVSITKSWLKSGARVPASVQRKRKNNIQRHKRHTSPFSKLPDVLVVEILSQLPPKSFFRCKSVCKTWLSLSFDASRLNKHLQPTMTDFFYNHLFDVSFVNFSCDINKVDVDGTMSALSCLSYRQIQDCCNRLLIVGAFKKPDGKVILDIFLYERGMWKCDKKLVLDVRINLYSKGTFVDGRVHRLTIQDEILSVDPNNCSYQVIHPPNLENCDMIEIG